MARERILLTALGFAALVAISGCKTFRDETTSHDVGPRIGFQLDAGWQETGDGTDQNDIPIYSEGAMASSTALFELGWGLQSGSVYFEPALLLGSGGGLIDNGRLIGIADAQYESWSGGAVGFGADLRVVISQESRFRLGLDFAYLEYEGESDFKVDALPSYNHRYDAQTRRLELLAVFDYDAEHWRPYLAAGILGNYAELQSQTLPNQKIEIETRNPFGAKIGLDAHHIGDSGFYGNLELGWFGGPWLGLGAGYRF